MTVAHEYDHTYDELHHLIDGLQPDQVRRLLRLVRSDPEFAAYADESGAADEAEGQEETPGRRRLASAGIFDSGRTDLSERVEEFVSERFNHSL